MHARAVVASPTPWSYRSRAHPDLPPGSAQIQSVCRQWWDCGWGSRRCYWSRPCSRDYPARSLWKPCPWRRAEWEKFPCWDHHRRLDPEIEYYCPRRVPWSWRCYCRTQRRFDLWPQSMHSMDCSCDHPRCWIPELPRDLFLLAEIKNKSHIFKNHYWWVITQTLMYPKK